MVACFKAMPRGLDVLNINQEMVAKDGNLGCTKCDEAKPAYLNCLSSRHPTAIPGRLIERPQQMKFPQQRNVSLLQPFKVETGHEKNGRTYLRQALY